MTDEDLSPVTVGDSIISYIDNLRHELDESRRLNHHLGIEVKQKDMLIRLMKDDLESKQRDGHGMTLT